MKRIKGTSQADQILGGDKEELIEGLGGADVLDGGGGDDIVDGGDGDDQLYGGAGQDLVEGGAGKDTLSGGEGADTLLGGDGDDQLTFAPDGAPDRLDGGAGTDLASINLRGATTNLQLDFGKAQQTLTDGTTLTDIEQVHLFSGSGHDQLRGGGLADRLWGGAGNDVLDGAGGADILNGEAGDDLVSVDSLDSVARGGDGTDLGFFDFRASAYDLKLDVAANLAGEVLVGDTWVSGFERLYVHSGSGDDTLGGGDLRDDLYGNGGDDNLWGGGGGDRLDGGAGDDTLAGGGGADTLSGGDGDDRFQLGVEEGPDQIDGGAGTDTVLMNRSATTANIVFDLGKGPQTLPDGTTIANVEQVHLYAGSGDDQLRGGALTDLLDGGDGSDAIDGGGGADHLNGGAGDDLVSADSQDFSARGGAGADLGFFDFRASAHDLKLDVAANLAGEVLVGDTWVSGFESLYVHSGSGDDTLGGGDLRDDLYGNAGDDRLRGGGGDDRLDGGAGDDLVAFSGTRTDYQVEQLVDGSLRIADLRGGPNDGVDVVSGVERFSFSDGVRTLEQLLGGNHAPVAVADSAGVGEDASVTVAVLANDTDQDVADTRSLVSVDAVGARGTATMNADGTVTYTPGAAFRSLAQGQTAQDSFTYTMRDAAGATSSATVTVQVAGANDAPVAVADAASVGEDGRVTLDLLANDSDVDAGAVLTLSSLNFTGTKGTAAINPDGTVTYDPGSAFQHLAAGETATDTFSYSVRDGLGGLATSTVTITVQGADEPDGPPPPAAHDDVLAFASNQGVALVGGLTANDEGQGLVVVSAPKASAAHALLYVKDGQVIYDPGDLFHHLSPGQTASDSFSYTVADATGATSTATVQVTITGASGAEIYRQVQEDATSDNLLADVMTAATDLYGPNATLTSIDASTTVGQVVFDPGAGVLTYSAVHPWLDRLWGDNLPPQTSFRYTVVDEAGESHVGTVVLLVEPQPDAPLAQADLLHQDAGTLSANLWNAVLGNDSDPDGGDTLRIVSVDFAEAVGEVIFDPVAHTLQYRALDAGAYGQSGEDHFSYTVRDASGLESTATVTIDIAPPSSFI